MNFLKALKNSYIYDLFHREAWYGLNWVEKKIYNYCVVSEVST